MRHTRGYNRTPLRNETIPVMLIYGLLCVMASSYIIGLATPARALQNFAVSRANYQHSGGTADTDVLPRYGRFGYGPVNILASNGNHAVVGTSDELRVIDIADRAAPRQIASTRLGSNITSIAMSGEYVLVATAPGGLTIISLSQPFSPRVVREIHAENPYGGARFVIASGSLAYVCEARMVRIIDISEPENAVPIGSVEIDSGVDTVWDIEVATNSLFISAASNIFVIGVEDPGHPKEIARISAQNGRNWMGVAVRDTLAFAGASFGGIVVFDISDPEHIVELYSVPPELIPEEHTHVSYGKPEIVGDTLYAPAREFGVFVFDIGSPGEPVRIGHINASDSCWRVIPLEDTLLVLEPQSGLFLWDIGNADNPARMSSFEWPSPTVGVEIIDDVLYTLAVTGRLLEWDISDIAQPALIGSFQVTEKNAERMELLGKTLIVIGDNSTKTYFVNVSDSGPPQSIFRGMLNEYYTDIAVCGARAFIGNYRGFDVVEMAEDGRPVLAGTLRAEEAQWVLSCDGRYVYAGIGSTVRVFDARDASNLPVVSELTVDDIAYIRDMSSSEGSTVVGSNQGLVFVNTVDSARPRVQETFPSITFVSAVYVYRDHAFVGSYGRSASMLEYSVYYPNDIKRIGSGDTHVYPDNDNTFYRLYDLSASEDVVAAAVGSGFIMWSRLPAVVETPSPGPSRSPTAPTPSPTPVHEEVRLTMPILLSGR